MDCLNNQSGRCWSKHSGGRGLFAGDESEGALGGKEASKKNEIYDGGLEQSKSLQERSSWLEGKTPLGGAPRGPRTIRKGRGVGRVVEVLKSSRRLPETWEGDTTSILRS